MGTYTSEVEGTLKCRGENRDPYILLRVVCAHMVRAPQILYLHVSVICNPNTTIGWKPNRTLYDRSADTNTAIAGIFTMKNKRMSIRRTKTIKIAKNSLFP